MHILSDSKSCLFSAIECLYSRSVRIPDRTLYTQSCRHTCRHTGLVGKVEMIGEREVDVLLLPEMMSRTERAGRAKKTNDSHCRAIRRRGIAIRRSSIVATLEGESLCITPFGLYPASRVSGRGPADLGKLEPNIRNPNEVYSRYIPRIYHVYSERLYIPGISQVHTLDIEFSFSWIYVQFNAINQCHG